MSDRRKKPLLALAPAKIDTDPVTDHPEVVRQKGQTHEIPRLCALDGFSEELNQRRGIDIKRLEPLTQLRVKTAETVYEMTVLEPFASRVLIQGGPLFNCGAEMKVAGASLGRSFLKLSSIWIGLQLELHVGDCTVVTSPVRSIEILTDTFPEGDFAA